MRILRICQEKKTFEFVTNVSQSVYWSFYVHEKVDDSSTATYIFIIQASSQCEYAGLWIQCEHIVAPIGDYRVCNDGIVTNISIKRIHNTNLIASWCILRHFERV